MISCRSVYIPVLPSLEAYAWAQEVIRCNATTVSGAPEVPAGGLRQCGQRKDDPTRPQIKGLLGSWEPWGRPLATEVWSGARADEGVDSPIIARRRRGLNKTGRLVVDVVYLVYRADMHRTPAAMRLKDALVEYGRGLGRDTESQRLQQETEEGDRVPLLHQVPVV